MIKALNKNRYFSDQFFNKSFEEVNFFWIIYKTETCYLRIDTLFKKTFLDVNFLMYNCLFNTPDTIVKNSNIIHS